MLYIPSSCIIREPRYILILVGGWEKTYCIKRTWDEQPAIDLRKTWRTWTTVCALKESRPEVGSSQNMTIGSVSSSAAKERRFDSPPDMPFNCPGIPKLGGVDDWSRTSVMWQYHLPVFISIGPMSKCTITSSWLTNKRLTYEWVLALFKADALHDGLYFFVLIFFRNSFHSQISLK